MSIEQEEYPRCDYCCGHHPKGQPCDIETFLTNNDYGDNHIDGDAVRDYLKELEAQLQEAEYKIDEYKVKQVQLVNENVELTAQLREAKKRQFYCHERKESTCDHQCANCAEWYRLVLEKIGKAPEHKSVLTPEEEFLRMNTPIGNMLTEDKKICTCDYMTGSLNPNCKAHGIKDTLTEDKKNDDPNIFTSENKGFASDKFEV